MANVALFDMNETTLDLAEVRATVNELFANPDGFTLWFQKILQMAMTSAATNTYQDFTVLAPSALRSMAETQGVELPVDAVPRLGAALAAIQPFPDVVDGMTSLRDAGWTTVALTNSALASVMAQVEATGLAPLFDHVVSVDAVKCYKPQAAPYLHALEVGGGEPSTTWMVACHDWDLHGARAVGIQTAFIARPHMAYAETYPQPRSSSRTSFSSPSLSSHNSRASHRLDSCGDADSCPSH